MGKNSRRRNVDKQRRAAERRRRQASRRDSNRHSGIDDRPAGRDATSDDASGAESDIRRRLEHALGLVLRERLWPHGWQPDELLHHTRRAAGMDAAEVLAMAIAADTAYHDRVGNAIGAAWRRQTDRIVARVDHEPDRDGWLARWIEAADAGAGDPAVRTLLRTLLDLRSLPVLIAPPGALDGAQLDVELLLEGDVTPSSKLVTIRALLAKAESTEFPAEAELFTAKAQQMMFEARLDEATVRGCGATHPAARVGAVRLSIDEPYVASKRSLLQVVADANDVRCVFHRGADLATLVGPVGQLAHVELLFTSLLIQVQSAMFADAADAPPGSHVRSRRYRSSFIVGYAERIGDRLRDMRAASFAAVTGDALPVLAGDERATSELFERLVGRTTRMRSSASYDAFGVRAGADAAEQAALRDTGLRGSTQPGKLGGAG